MESRVGTGSVGTEGMGVMGGDTHIQCCGGGRHGCDWRRHSLTQCWDGRQCCVVMTERKGRKVGTGSVGTEGMGVMGGDTHRQFGTEGSVWSWWNAKDGGRHRQRRDGRHGVMGGDTHRQYWDGRQCCVVMTERKGRKVGTGSVGTEGMGVMGGDTHSQCRDGRHGCDGG